MPWREASPMDQRTQFIADHLRDVLSITELCALYGISRKTGYKWIDRYIRHGPAGLEEDSRRPRRSPNQTSEEVVSAILDARRRHPRWGGKKLLALLQKRHPRWHLPGRSTACDILSRHGMVPLKRQRRRIGHPGKPTSQILAPKDVWSADYKGQFRTGDGRYCYPLTVADGFSRYLLGCQALTSTAVDEAKPIFTRLFHEYGLPTRMRSDNGVRGEFTRERRREALDHETPAACYAPAPRPRPDRLPPLEYPDRFEVRYVSANGGVRWSSRWVNVSTVCIGEYVGLEEIDDGIWNVYFGPLRLGRLSERHMRIEDEYGRLYRRHV